jgi:hypothetical protein
MYGVRDNAAGQAWYDSIFRQYAAWGLDFVKVDDLSAPYATSEVEQVRKAIDGCGRTIVFSTSPGPAPVEKADHLISHANMWRTTGDFWDSWTALSGSFGTALSWEGIGGPGHWPDADMLPLGHLGPRCPVDGPDRRTAFTKNMQLTLMTLWAIAPSPLMVGADLPDNDPWTLALLTNDEILAVNQDALGAKARQVSKDKGIEVWERKLANGDKAVAIFNRRLFDMRFQYGAGQKLRDLWRHKDLASPASLTIPARGAVLLRVRSPKQAG